MEDADDPSVRQLAPEPVVTAFPRGFLQLSDADRIPGQRFLSLSLVVSESLRVKLTQKIQTQELHIESEEKRKVTTSSYKFKWILHPEHLK